MSTSHAAVILAGGPGTRLWPLSRRHRPKQLLRLIGGRSLLADAFERLRGIVPVGSIYVVALAEHRPAIAAELPELPPENILGEPMARDTAAAIALAAAILHERDPATIMGVFTADHLIRPADRFAEVVRRGYQAAADHGDALITFGIRPTEVNTGMGYVQRGEEVSPGLWRVRAFKEKPDLETARRYVAAGDYDWNSGMFVWRAGTILDELARRLGATHEAARRIAAAWKTADGPRVAAEAYPGLAKISIDYAVMEKAANVLLVEMPVEWLDVGSWTALPAALGRDAAGHTRAAAETITLGGEGNILVSEDEHLIATIGVSDLVVVHSADATLICRREDVQRIKELVAELDSRGAGRFS